MCYFVYSSREPWSRCWRGEQSWGYEWGGRKWWVCFLSAQVLKKGLKLFQPKEVLTVYINHAHKSLYINHVFILLGKALAWRSVTSLCFLPDLTQEDEVQNADHGDESAVKKSPFWRRRRSLIRRRSSWVRRRGTGPCYVRRRIGGTPCRRRRQRRRRWIGK